VVWWFLGGGLCAGKPRGSYDASLPWNLQTFSHISQRQWSFLICVTRLRRRPDPTPAPRTIKRTLTSAGNEGQDRECRYLPSISEHSRTSYNSTLRVYLFSQHLRFLVFILKALKEGSHTREVPAQPSSKSRHLLFTSSQKENARGTLCLEAQASRAGWMDLETIREPESRCQMPRRAGIIAGSPGTVKTLTD
jgi:hypothetical protein